MSAVQPNFKLITITTANQRLFQGNSVAEPVRTQAVRVKFQVPSGNAADVRLGWSVGADRPEPGAYTAPVAALTDDTAWLLAKGTAAVPITHEWRLSAEEIAKGNFYELSEWFVNGTGSDKLRVEWEPPDALNIP